MDLVYVIGTGSRWDDNELKYSLRSVEKHGTNVGKVIIVGYLPEWIQKTQVIHIPESFDFYKERNIMECIRLACKNTKVSKDFLYMNDDFFFNLDFDCAQFPTYVRPYDLHEYVWGAERTKNRWNKYTRIIEQTHNALLSRGLPILTYDLHVPMPINKKKYLEAVHQFDWNCPKRLGYTYRSIYGNYWQIPATIHSDVKYHKIATWEGFLRSVSDKPFFSTDDSSDIRHLQTALEILYPKKSRWEV